ncbi:MarR family transcriptional regulator, partial [Streptomyces albidoflavus]|uniref:MarR family transcriptional regulator n=1 Tax=Streptomyces albidoflavus TaxID=1886 RepID=UPI00332094F2
MTGAHREREESLDVIQRELTAFARRARATAARLHPDLPLVSYTLLAHIDYRQGCRATDLAAHYMLDKSTVSRQVAALEKLGLVERHPDRRHVPALRGPRHRLRHRPHPALRRL